MYEVIYYSRTGNTRKVAEAIATELGTSAKNVKGGKKLTEDSFVFLGSGFYGGKPAAEIVQFIDENDFGNRKVAIFGTSGRGPGEEVKIMGKILLQKGAKVSGKFFCRGKFLLFGRKHPDSEELEAARKFAEEMREN
jgi:flavodoxin I